ncbi:Uu.00g116500.m01.CDS01 [Anthostomella pinea]|uniref:Uu.00g116500.m01.CDS01 n=1 Tax=Anthostomella pinea TaxID=933095 RepID=A0AAI8VGR6_9PEZI|nr:Uu.00g116500.m01.CDS01 [Anthostomella pinea]
MDAAATRDAAGAAARDATAEAARDAAATAARRDAAARDASYESPSLYECCCREPVK